MYGIHPSSSYPCALIILSWGGGIDHYIPDQKSREPECHPDIEDATIQY